MRRVTMKVMSPERNARAAYGLVCEFADYPQLTETVEEVVVQPQADGSVVSAWAVHFRNGTLRWIERDTFDDVRMAVSFQQLSGDFQSFEGVWLTEAVGAGSMVTFDAEFDLGIPTLASILDPVAESTLRSNVLQILSGLLGEVYLLEDDALAQAN